MDDARLPPGQQLAAAGKWPQVGERAPALSDDPWTLEVAGAVGSPVRYTLEELRALPQISATIDIHCVTRWSKLGMRFSGVSLTGLFDRATPRGSARFVKFIARSERRHSTSLPLDEVRRLQPLIALIVDDRPIEESHGGPIRLIVPDKYFYKSLKWLERIELLEEDQLGYWEESAGYHNEADPLLEQRYVAANVPPRVLRELLAANDFSDGDLLSVDVAGRDLRGLRAVRAKLRNANFRGCDLSEADFRRSNCTNASFADANLARADFTDADVEGAEFLGADLRGVSFRNASLFGASFAEAQSGDRPARLDDSTVMDREAVESLTPVQVEVVRRLGVTELT